MASYQQNINDGINKPSENEKVELHDRINSCHCCITEDIQWFYSQYF